MNNEAKVRMAAFRISFLMPHQEVNSDLELEALSLGAPTLNVNKDCPEYLQGAQDALLHLIHMLEGKGPQIKE
jgi:hypothetical protein